MKPTPTAQGLPRVLGPLMTTALVIGTVIGSGVFKKPAVIAGAVPTFGLTALVWVLGGLLVALGALAYAEVAVLLPRSGGNYVFLREGYGRLFGFLWGWVDFLIIRTASIAALATIFTESLNDVLGGVLGYWGRCGMTVGVIVALALVNARGVRWGGGLQVLVTAVKVGSLLLIAAAPLLALAFLAGGDTARPDGDRLRPLWPSDWSAQVSMAGVVTAFLGVLWAYHGWMNLASVAEEVHRPQRNLPLALLGGVAAVIFLYLSANLAYHLVIPRPEMAKLTETTVAGELGRRMVGPAGLTLASAAVMVSVFGALNGNLLVGPRLLYAMGDDGLAPRGLRAVHPAYQTPARAILTLAAWSSLLVLGVAVLTWAGTLAAVKSPFDRLTDFAMFGAVIFETLAVLTVFVLRRTMPDAPRPYRCWGYPWVPALYVLLPAFILGNLLANALLPAETLVWLGLAAPGAPPGEQQAEVVAGVGIILAGVLVYFACGLGRTAPTPPGLDLGDKGIYEPRPSGSGVRPAP
jgi:amino acid transporter